MEREMGMERRGVEWTEGRMMEMRGKGTEGGGKRGDGSERQKRRNGGRRKVRKGREKSAPTLVLSGLSGTFPLSSRLGL